ncbi:hypothetical protein [Mycetocola saprophilus]|uniref:hypothetical protein n=1 Tax=Mycetocola saprophilus TaxID=76636 RepID=UPI003BF1E3D7
MRSSTRELNDVILGGSFTRELIVDVMHGTEPVLKNLPLTGWSIRANLGADVKLSGTATCVYTDDNGLPFAPSGSNGVLSPYRARLMLKMRISAGDFSEDVLIGWGRVVKTPGAKDYWSDEILGERRVTSSVVPIEWSGLEYDIQRTGFTFPTPAGPAAWAELAKISGLPVTRNVPDVPIPANTVWEAKQGGRLEAVHKIAALLSGRAMVTPMGALMVAPNRLPDKPALTLETGVNGTITAIDSDISIDGVYNEVAGLYEVGEDRTPIHSVARITTGPLAVGGLFGTATMYHDSDMVTSQESADKATQAVLDESIGSQTYRVQVQCITNPLIETNDFVEVRGKDRTVRGRVVEYELSDSALMSITLQVPMAIA